MSGHFVVEVNVKEVIEPHVIEGSRGVVTGGKFTDRQVIDRLRVVVSKDTEAGAILQAIQMLKTAAPFPGPADEIAPHLHRASCDDAGGNLMCGFPPGPTIASAPR